MLSVMVVVCLSASAVSQPAETSADRLALSIQIEKLRMNVFEVRDIVVGERRLNAGFGSIGGLALVLHGSLVHRSHANASARSRHAYTFHAVDPRAHYSRRNWLQPSSALPFPQL